MTEALAKKQTTVSSQTIEQVLIGGDLSKLNTEQRLSYYKAVCESVGLNPLTKPFDYINLSGRLVLYAKRDATDQLRKIHKVSITNVQGRMINDVYVVTAEATDVDDRQDSSTGAVNVANLKGEALANALMKAETKAKRRVTLSICGLGLLDETEIETIPDARPIQESPEPDTRTRGRGANNRRSAAPPQENIDVKCAQCGAINGHLPDCPTKQKKAPEAEVMPPESNEVEWYVETVEEMKSSKGSTFLKVSCLDANSNPHIAVCFHGTPRKHAKTWVEMWAKFKGEHKTGNNGPYFLIDKVLKVGSVVYQDNEPSEAPSSGDLGFEQ